MCTANQCRSPMAEVLLRHHLENAGVPATVSSCGLFGGGAPAAAVALEAMAGRGFDLSPHRSRRLVAFLVDESDLVLTMAREHLREVVVLAPEALTRTFTLKELVRRGEAAPPRLSGEALESYLGRIGEGRRIQDLLGEDPEDDVEDPMGAGIDACKDTAAELDDLCRRAAALLTAAP